MVDSNYKIGWQVACWSTVAVTAFSALAFILYLVKEGDAANAFSIFMMLSFIGMGVGNLLCSLSLTKGNHPAAALLKNAAIVMFIGAFLGFLSTVISPRSTFVQVLVFIMMTGFAVCLFLYQGQFSAAVKNLGLPIGFIEMGLLIVAIAIALIAVSVLVIIISLKAIEVVYWIQTIACLVVAAGSALSFVTMLPIINNQK